MRSFTSSVVSEASSKQAYLSNSVPRFVFLLLVLRSRNLKVIAGCGNEMQNAGCNVKAVARLNKLRHFEGSFRA